MKDQNYWKKHYVIYTNADEVERKIKLTSFISSGENFELIYFEKAKDAPNILISQGSGGHAFVFAELGYLLHRRGYNVFIMPKHGGYTISELVARQRDALEHIKNSFSDRIGIFSEGLGGFVTFYLALARGSFKSVIYQNAPAIITEKKFQEAIIRGQRKMLIPFIKFLLKMSPRIKLPISSYLNWKELIDPKEANKNIESHLVIDGYLKDPDFDTWYPLSAITSLLFTPPPAPLSELSIPTMFMVAQRGFGGDAYVEYLKDLYSRLPSIKKKIMEVDGSVYWVLSHPKEATEIICKWFKETL